MKWPLHVIFDGPSGHEAGRFVEVNDDTGKSVNAGEWVQKDGFWELIIKAPHEQLGGREWAKEYLAEFIEPEKKP